MVKLSSLYGRTVSLIAIVFIISFSVLALAFTSISSLNSRDDIRELERTVLLANSSVREFIITRDPAHAKRTELLLIEADEMLRHEITDEDFSQIHTSLLLYLHSISELIDVYKDRGFYEEVGVEGALRRSMLVVEERFREVGDVGANILILQTRRSEKNYFLRGRDEYRFAVHDEIDRIQLRVVESETMTAAHKNETLAQLAIYQKNFDDLVYLNNKVNWIKSELGKVRDYLSKSIAVIIDREDRRAQSYLWIALGLILFSFVFGILYATYVARSVVRPLEKMREAAKKLARGEMSDFDVDENSIVAELGETFQELADQIKKRQTAEEKLRSSKEELQSYAKELEKTHQELNTRAEELSSIVGELEEAKETAENATRSKTAFLASMSHEIRTPLSGIIGMTSLMADEDMDEDQAEVVNVIRSSGETLLGLVNNILDFAKIEQGGLTLESEPMDLTECIEAALDVVSKQAADKRLDLSYQIEDSIAYNFTGDRSRLRQILVNLLGNAVKFTGAGEISVSAKINEVTDSSIEIQFSVEDTGIGIADETIDTLFQPFQQADVSTSRKFGGTGLGLTIARQLAELMGGRMWVESKVGLGSKFIFTAIFDIDKDSDKPTPDEDYAAERTIILMNRNPLFGTAVKTTLERAGGTVYLAESEDEAVEIIQRVEKVDLIMINDNADGLDGVAGGAIAMSLQSEAPGSKIVLLRNLGARFPTGVVTTCLPKPLKQAAFRQLFSSRKKAGESSKSVSKKSARNTAEDRSPNKPAVHDLKVLVVEDNLVNQKVAVRMLERLGYQADVADNGAIGVEAVVEKGYDVVFMDIMMPHMDGISATAAIRSHQDVKRQPFIIALTANATTEDRKKCLEGGMDDYASKPVSTEILGRLLEKAAVAQRMRHGTLARGNKTSNSG